MWLRINFGCFQRFIHKQIYLEYCDVPQSFPATDTGDISVPLFRLNVFQFFDFLAVVQTVRIS